MEKEYIRKTEHGYETMLHAVEFTEDKTVIAHCPALDKSGYGQTAKEAKERLRTAILNFIGHADIEGSVEKELLELGWKASGQEKNTMLPPSMTDVLERNEGLRNALDKLPEYRKYGMIMKVKLK